MKQIIKLTYVILSACVLNGPVFAYDFEVDGIYYGYNASNQSAYVTYGDVSYKGAVSIPSTVSFNGRTLEVTAIEGAFHTCHELKSVQIPNSIKTIGTQAFKYCTGLVSIELPNSITEIGHQAFQECCSLKEIRIPNSVIFIGDYAFGGCPKLETLIFEDGTESVSISRFNQDYVFAEYQTQPRYIYLGRELSNLAGQWYSSYDFITTNMEVLTIGSNVKQCLFNYLGSDNNLKIIYSKLETPEKCTANFSNYTYVNTKLYVPTGTKEKYMAAEGWKNFFLIEEMDVDKMWNGKGDPNGSDQEKNKCEKPTISYDNGKLTFSSATPNAICQSTITDSDISSFSGNEVQLTVTYTINVYATASGYENSDVVTATLCWIDADPKTEGIENGISQVRANAVLIQSHDGTLSIAGVADGTDIAVYSVSGQMVGSAKAHGTTSTVTTTLRSGNVAIVRIGDKSVKVVMQ